MSEFLQTGPGIALLIAGQSLLVVGFVMISLLYSFRKACLFLRLASWVMFRVAL